MYCVLVSDSVWQCRLAVLLSLGSALGAALHTGVVSGRLLSLGSALGTALVGRLLSLGSIVVSRMG